MATTPHAQTPTPAPAPKQSPPPAAPPTSEAKAAAPPAPTQQHAVLDPANALALFRNGHRIAPDGGPPDAWISGGRASDGVELYQQPMTQALADTITSGVYYLIDDQAYLDPGT